LDEDGLSVRAMSDEDARRLADKAADGLLELVSQVGQISRAKLEPSIRVGRVKSQSSPSRRTVGRQICQVSRASIRPSQSCQSVGHTRPRTKLTAKRRPLPPRIPKPRAGSRGPLFFQLLLRGMLSTWRRFSLSLSLSLYFVSSSVRGRGVGDISHDNLDGAVV